jgi:hypothetical protein
MLFRQKLLFVLNTENVNARGQNAKIGVSYCHVIEFVCGIWIGNCNYCSLSGLLTNNYNYLQLFTTVSPSVTSLVA